MKPRLYIFAISHFCEKARWALDHLDIEYDLAFLAPGFHSVWARKRELEGTTLPALDLGGEVIQGSDRIIDWADAATKSSRKLTPDSDSMECIEIERRLDEISGVHTRRMFYSEALIEHSSTVRPIFTKDLSVTQRAIVSAMWPIVRQAMIRSMDLGYEQGLESRRILDGELDWLDGLLADGRRFLVGDSLSRSDIAASSLFSRLCSPEQHPSFQFLTLPPRMNQVANEWRNRDSLRWIRANYQEFRLPT